VTDPRAVPVAWRIGVVGYGEVGRILAEDLRTRGVAQVVAYDTKLGGDDGALRDHAARHGIALAASHAELAQAADLILSAVTASQTVPAATACAAATRPGAWFLDLNSASPGAKQKAAEAIDATGAAYVEAAVMTPVPPYRIQAPLLLGGGRAAELQPLLAGLGFRARAVSAKVGVASATKLCRSVMIKGLEAMVIEAFTAARAYGVEREVLASLAESYPGVDWEQQGAYFFQRVIAHGRRRAEEMREAAITVRDAGLEPWSAAGTAERQAWMAELAEAGAFAGPDAPDDDDDWRAAADRVLRHLKR
jgi:3-hydroxyisobutyrate dehydrogenase-like beta-hydroxyacid dehydrogenase